MASADDVTRVLAESARDEPVLTANARKVLETRYLKKDERGNCLETPRDLFRRVAKTVADVELLYGVSEEQRQDWEQCYYELMTSGAFLPNSPTLMNAGREMGMLSACFVLPVRDSVVDIFNSIKHTALIQKAGGGTGFAFDELRPTGDFIQSSGGTTSGPISFWRAFSEATNAIQQGAFRRGANMGMMYIHHPDILKFLHAKQDLSQFNNYNISVKVTDVWMEDFKADADGPHVVRNPRSGKAYVIPRELDIWDADLRDYVEIACVEPVHSESAGRYHETPRLTGELPESLQGKMYTKREVWNIIVHNAWQTGEPGVVFMDRINEHNPTPLLGRIEATNPCGEQPLLPYEACNLGSINLGLFVTEPNSPEADVDWQTLREVIRQSVRFLDNVIDANNYPLPEIERICKANRKVGLGIMGFADALFKLGVPYNSAEGIAWGGRFMQFVNDEAHAYSEQLARWRGPFPNWKGSRWHTCDNRVMRNAAATTVAPTGTISIIANCTGGIEPLFSLAFLRNVLRDHKDGHKPLVEVNETFRQVCAERGILRDGLLEEIARAGTLAHIDEIPEDIKRVFVCAHDIEPEWHVQMQATFQRHCDSSISKTINFAHDAVREDVGQIYCRAFELGCKGVTVYRDGSRSFQPMTLKKQDGAPQSAARSARATAADSTDEAAATDTSVASIKTNGPGNGKTHKPVAAQAQDSAAPTATASGRLSRVALPATTAAPPVRTLEPRDLPEIVSGLRIRQMTPFGNMHVKITVDPRSDRELEVFAQLGKGGDVANSDLEAICRIVSLWLRSGGGLRHIFKQLEGIGSSLQIPTRSGTIMSLGDGLACALKKYTRAKERFGLRALLLGEIDLAELDNPNPAPHTRASIPLDRPVQRTVPPAAPRASGAPRQLEVRGGRGAALPPKRSDVIDRPVLAQNADELHSGERRSSRTAPPPQMRAPASTVPARSELHATFAETSSVRAEPEGLPDDHLVSVALAEETTISEPLPETKTVTATATEVGGLVDWSRMMSPARHHHDAATHYKLACPECSAALVVQEGCRKCLHCGWAAC